MPMMDRGWWQRDLQLNTPQGGDKICWKDFHVCHTRPELAEPAEGKVFCNPLPS